MDYYSEKHSSVCIDDKSLDDGVNQITDIIVKNNKIYKVKNRFYIISDQNDLEKFIEDCAIKCDFLLESSKRGEVFLKQNNSLSYIIISSKLENQTNNKYWTVEIVEPEVISNA